MYTVTQLYTAIAIPSNVKICTLSIDVAKYVTGHICSHLLFIQPATYRAFQWSGNISNYYDQLFDHYKSDK